jgi:hypothetical protein
LCRFYRVFHGIAGFGYFRFRDFLLAQRFALTMGLALMPSTMYGAKIFVLCRTGHAASQSRSAQTRRKVACRVGRREAGIVNMKLRRRTCLCCRELFIPDPRNRHHQEFCSELRCQRARQALNLHRWRGKSENKTYFQGKEQVERVRVWRKAHPGYWKRTAKPAGADPNATSGGVHAPGTTGQNESEGGTLQKDWMPADPLVVGIIALIAGSTLQKDIVAACAGLIATGNEIRHKKTTRES